MGDQGGAVDCCLESKDSAQLAGYFLEISNTWQSLTEDFKRKKDFVEEQLNNMKQHGCSTFLAGFQVMWGLGRFPVELLLAVKAHPLAETEKFMGDMVAKVGIGVNSGGLVPVRGL